MTPPETDLGQWRDTPSTDGLVARRPGAGNYQWLLADLLGLVQQLLDVDTVTLLLLGGNDRTLECVAAVGHLDAVQQAYQVPVGTGFSGRIAASRQPLVVGDRDIDSVTNSYTSRLGIRSLLGVPLLLDERLLGVLHVGSLTARHFTPDDTAALVRAAERVAHTVVSHSTEAENVLAVALQRNLIPLSPPPVPGLDLASRYIPADGQLGGDWHDVFVLPSGKVGLVIGDVVGHGLAAAVVMGRLRSALRSYAIEHDDPADVVTRLDAKIHHFEEGAMATVLYAVTEPPFDRIRLSSAGHPAPLLAAEGRPTEELDVEADPPLGVGWEGVRATSTFDLPPGSSICLFTDGLIERPPGPDDVDFDQLSTGQATLLEAFTADDVEMTCGRVLDASIHGVEVINDDIAILIARPTGPSDRG